MKPLKLMINDARGLAFLLALSIGVASALLVGFIATDPGFEVILVTFLSSLFAAFVCTYFFLEKFVFAERKKLRSLIRESGLEKASESNGKKDSVESLSEDFRALMEKKQQEIDRLKNVAVFRKDFIADVSHELKTPIFAAQGFIHTLLDGAVKEKGVRKKFLKKAAKSLDGLDLLVQDLLTLSQMETGQIRMHFEEFDLYALTEDVIDEFKSRVSKKNIALRIESRSRTVPVYADPKRIRQVLTNLISNAINHSEEGGEVVVSFSARKTSVVTRIKDSGDGIPAEHIGQIFQRFYRVDKSRSREKGGTGLGLAIVKHILDGHKSRARVESAPGQGSTFSFKLPRAKKEETKQDHE